MANFAKIANQLEGILNTQLSSVRSTQGAWEWYNALQRIMSANRFTGTPTVYGPATVADADYVDIETPATTLFGVLIDNSNSAEVVYVSFSDEGSGGVPGTALMDAIIMVPSATMVYVVYPDGISFPTNLGIYAGTGTAAGLEGGTAVTGTNPTGVVVYTL